MMSIIIPANNEAGYIGPCLDSLLAQKGISGEFEIIVAANACTDTTIEEAEQRRSAIETQGWPFSILDIAEGGKPHALNRGDAAAAFPNRLYLDADVRITPTLLNAVSTALAKDYPVYCGGKLEVAPARTWITRRYAEIWSRLPFMTASGTTGAGLFAVNAAGRARWEKFPEIISDDTFVRLQFAPEERICVEARYLWPMVEGFEALVRVRRRQDAGLAEIAEEYPELFENEGKPPMGFGDHLSLFLRFPVSYAVYVSVALAVKSRRSDRTWSRGR